jgi:PEP-CTERM motif
MRALILTLLCALTALPAAAQEFEIDITGQTADQQSGSLSFDINANSGTQVYNADGSFSFTNVAISAFVSNINGMPYLDSSTATGLWAKDVSPFGGFQITGPSGSLFSAETDLVLPVTINPNAPLDSFLSQGIFPASVGSLGQFNFTSEVIKVTPVGASVPEPGTIPLMVLAAVLLAIVRARRGRWLARLA